MMNRSFLVTLLLTMACFAKGQILTSDSLLMKLEDDKKHRLQEKLYVDLDEDVHLAGENLWFKMYCVDVFDHQYLSVSKVGYLEILDSENKPILQTKIELNNGAGSGVVRIPPVSTGTYHLRAYTHWMKNFSQDFYFHKNIGIINTLLTPDASKNQPSDKIEMNFFPEGGYLINGINTRVAFRCNTAWGEGLPFKGYVLDTQTDTVARFEPLKFGIGSFEFKPMKGKDYKAIVYVQGKQPQTFQLPPAKDEGFSLRVAQTDNNVHVTVRRIGASGNKGYMVVHSHQQVEYASAFSFQEDRALISFRQDLLKGGISHITVFDEVMQPRAERLIFRKPAAGLDLEIHTDQRSYETRKKVTIELSLQGALGSQDSAGLSLAVVKAYPGVEEPSIGVHDYLWLTSDLAGTVESPAYYLESQDPEVEQATDNLMMTHGWRRFNWTDLSTKSVPGPKYLPEYNGHLIRARVTDTVGRPVRSVLTFLSSPGRASRIYPSYSDDTGEVKYETLHLKGSRRIVLQADPSKDSTVRIDLISPFSTDYSTIRLPSLQLQPSVKSSLRERSIAMQVQQLYELKTGSPEKEDTSNFYGLGSEKYRLDDYIRFTVMEEVMREYVKGIWIRKKSDGFHFQVHDNIRHKVFVEHPLVLMDGVPVFNINRVMQYDPLLVSRLELVTSKYYLGPVTFYGIVSYHTYQGDLRNFQLDPSSIVIDYEALQQRREFYSPNYEKSRADRRPDQRTVLTWLPTVWCKPGEKKKIEFYTSDIGGRFVVLAEGISVAGKSGGGTGTFEVRPTEP